MPGPRGFLQLVLWLPADLRVAVRAKAKRDGRSVVGVVRQMLREWVAK